MTGMRPGEACLIRRSDIDMGGAIWLYKPVQHKTAWKGKARTVAIGPRAQELLRGFFTTNISDYLFSPVRAVEELHAERTRNRKTPRWNSHMERNIAKRKVNPELKPAEFYNPHAIGHAVDRACNKAFPPPAELAQRGDETHAEWWNRLNGQEREEVKLWQKKHQWHPNRLRHSHATKVRKEFGLEAAGAALGHSKMSATEIYAERDAQLALNVAAKLG
jgi:integrase